MISIKCTVIGCPFLRFSVFLTASNDTRKMEKEVIFLNFVSKTVFFYRALSHVEVNKELVCIQVFFVSEREIDFARI